MESEIAKALRLPLQPVALLFSDERPAQPKQFAEDRWGCVMWLLASAAKGKTAVADRSTFGCIGGGTGLGFGNRYVDWPGGIECFYYFLSTGNEEWEHGREAVGEVGGALRRQAVDHFVHGERYVKTPELAEKFVHALPFYEVPARYVVFKPLSEVGEEERPEIVIFLVDPDRLSALVVLANYAREDNENVIIPYAAGCQTIGIYAFREARSEKPRAVVGLTDLSARSYIAKQVGRDLMTFAAPFAMFEEMESNVAGSFLERDTWQSLLAENPR
jgi:uncharacterized protein (DUF169 family)